MKRFAIYLSMLVASLSASAYDFMVDGIAYDKNSDGNTVSVTYTVYFSNTNYSYISGSLIIPEKVTYEDKTYSITAIGEYAFRSCSELTSVTIPNSVTTINTDAFSGCSGLTSVTIPNSVTSIKNRVFSGCRGLTSVTIPNSVTEIGTGAFSGCYGLTSVEYNAVNCSGPSPEVDRWFKDCPLKTLKIGDKVESIPAYLASHQKSLTNIIIPNSVTSIGVYAFEWCSGLTSVTIPNSVIEIGTGAFYLCNNIDEINICCKDTCDFAKYVQRTDIFSIFHSSIKTTSVLHNIYISGVKQTTVTIPNSVTSIGAGAFYKCSGLTTMTISSFVTKIGASAFSGCTGLREIYTKYKDPITLESEVFGPQTYENAILHVPEGCEKYYKIRSYWKNFVTIWDDNGQPGNEPSTGDNIEGDVNGDGKVDISDVNRIIDIILGL